MDSYLDVNSCCFNRLHCVKYARVYTVCSVHSAFFNRIIDIDIDINIDFRWFYFSLSSLSKVCFVFWVRSINIESERTKKNEPIDLTKYYLNMHIYTPFHTSYLLIENAQNFDNITDFHK